MKVMPDNFLWGASHSAYQYEGAAQEDGKKLSQILVMLVLQVMDIIVSEKI